MHLIDTKHLKKQTILKLFALASSFKKNPWQTDLLKHKTIAMLFFENSTRTRVSFELAAKRLGASVIHVDLASSSMQKGETVLDTVLTLSAMNIDGFIIRHQEDTLCQFIVDHLKTPAVIINAGNGTQSHPSQALLDAFTIHEHKPNFAELSIAIVGDSQHSRVAHSNIHCLQNLGVKDLRLVGPQNFLPDNDLGCKLFTDFNKGIANTDVIMMLRIQKERMKSSDIPDMTEYTASYQLNETKLKLAKADALVMHPGPINRGIEITDAVADGRQSVILQQVQNGVFMRQAILQWLFEKRI